MESEAEHDAGGDVMAEENVGNDEKIAEEDDDTTVKDLDTTMAVDLNMTVDGGTGGKPDVTDSEGETPVFDSQGETPIFDSEGETPVKIVEGETPGTVVSGRETSADVEGGNPVENVSKGATPVTAVEGETPRKVVEGETPDVTEEPTSGGLQDIVDLVNEHEGDETPVDKRLVRRRTRRRSLLDEVDEPTGAWELNLTGQGARPGGDVPEESDAYARRLAIERKRKDKQEARILPKNPRRTLLLSPLRS